jgi:A/G-specific adenine glycosylase
MLQQTRAQAVVPYYQRFLERFPALEDLAAASEEEVLTLWSGLGYYARARNLRKAACQIAATGFPRDYDAIRALPGVGDYTAAAVASIAFGEPRAVLDGNVLRVVARVAGDASDIAAPRTRERFRAITQGWLDPRQPGAFNQAIMELGATICLSRNPLCLLCPIADHCQARLQGAVAQLPVKLRLAKPMRIEAELVLAREGDCVLLRKIAAGAARMAGFWELPAPEHLPPVRARKVIGAFRHTITHHRYTFTVIAARLANRRRLAGSKFHWFDREELARIPLSTTARKALQLAGFQNA